MSLRAHSKSAILAAVLLSGCAGSMSEVLREKHEGQGLAATYDVPADRAWQIAETILRWDGAGTIEKHRDGNYLLTTIYRPSVQGTDAMTYIGAWIEPSSAGQVKMTCVVSGPKVFAAYTEDDFQRRFQQATSLTKDGRALPDAAPPRPLASR